jgi:small subunit ribosomal protein S6
LHTYEFMYILSPEVEEEDLEAVVGRIGQIIADGGGQVLRVESWGRKRLAYPIRRFREGHYVLAYIQLDPGAVAQLRSRLALTEEVIRYLLLRSEELPPEVAKAATPEEPATAEQPEAEPVAEPAEEATEPASEPAEEPAEPEPAQEQGTEDSEQTGVGD